MFDPIAYINEPRWQTVSLGLERIRELLEALGRPQDSLRFVHVAGTNGKGSTCAFIASICQCAGYRTGLFTSPALYHFEDRIRVNGKNITAEELFDVTKDVKAAADAMSEHPTEFELLTAVAFCHFARQGCDIVVAEVGLGGRLDSTNVIELPEVSVITPISFDHCAMLGNTLSEIAREKAGIIKAGAPVVSAPQEQAVREVIERSARRERSALAEVDLSVLDGTIDGFSYRGRTGLSSGLSGDFQLVNAASALDAVDVLQAAGWSISEEAVEQGLKCVSWPGRFEVVSEEPLVIFDGGHNVAGMEALVRALDGCYPNHHRIVLTGVLADKDYPNMADLLATAADEIVTITPPNPRALSADDYACVLLSCGEEDGRRLLGVTPAASIASGVQRVLQRYRSVQEQASSQPLICVCGSLYMLGAVMEVLRQVGIGLEHCA